MILEHEIIEQVMDSPRPLPWVVGFIRDHGKDPWRVLGALWKDDQVVLLDPQEARLADWEVLGIFRTRRLEPTLRVGCTEKALRLVT